MKSLRNLVRRRKSMLLLLLFVAGDARSANSASFGVNFQTDRGGYPTSSVGAETPAAAFGVDAINWFEPGSVPVGASVFATNGGNVNIEWTSFPDAAPGIAYGWMHANQGAIPSPPGDPMSGEDAVLSGFLFATGADEAGYANGTPIVVTLSNLGSIAKLSAGYTVSLYASSEWTVDEFTSASVQDNAANSQMIDFAIMPEHPLWWTGPPWESTGAVGTSTANLFTGNSLTITLEGFNEIGTSDPTDAVRYLRTALSGLKIEFVPVPEPSSIVLAISGVLAWVGIARSWCPRS